MDNQDSTSFASILAGVQRLRENGEVAREPENKQVQRQQQSPQPVQRQPSPHIGQKRINAFNQDKSRSQGPKVPKPSSLNVNSRQKQNPLMSSLTNVNYIFVEQRNVYDFLVNGRDVIFLSLKYHKLHPEYIQNRMKPLMKKNAILLSILHCFWHSRMNRLLNT
ncbi:DNA repair protein RAD10 [Cyberlindnera jadinii NRRL Y-1542]|uniref:Rad10-domain-containing protein n=1 Tax=Cyberlindnera jadinii (strain ATCC 18201 / CBS 1600 / BCRC 20928 / JCM 3617 / NBRC 0987 / NRRL Y-1542) TaxID=983966 RepID=A0A1E4RYW6_CYBJN|nr:Rad10-domain-containing protein [Cyberlindnera jadinii NRRL Y-1542]ODV72456.1 Rad10-domain-containing protein [Cyberlindnera jadinii NRRL Y-1542]